MSKYMPASSDDPHVFRGIQRGGTPSRLATSNPTNDPRTPSQISESSPEPAKPAPDPFHLAQRRTVPWNDYKLLLDRYEADKRSYERYDHDYRLMHAEHVDNLREVGELRDNVEALKKKMANVSEDGRRVMRQQRNTIEQQRLELQQQAQKVTEQDAKFDEQHTKIQQLRSRLSEATRRENRNDNRIARLEQELREKGAALDRERARVSAARLVIADLIHGIRRNAGPFGSLYNTLNRALDALDGGPEIIEVPSSDPMEEDPVAE
uniref:Uncharacterized protein n=1 Tax=Mycena chlorophos TaxID=658473 RepID=A0ABQ0L2P8_MYCCL|nr:predicted protein [Mycena chlorophos]